MKCTQAELVAAKTAIRRRHGCDSYYVGSHESVNLAEATTALISKRGYSFVDAKAAVIELHADTIPFDESQAYETARLQPITRGRGLSLGDRACIALARARGSAAVTADTIWGLDVDGVPVVQIR